VSPTEVRGQREGDGDIREVIEETGERVRGERERACNEERESSSRDQMWLDGVALHARECLKD
jgi:hypothetical protein